MQKKVLKRGVVEYAFSDEERESLHHTLKEIKYPKGGYESYIRKIREIRDRLKFTNGILSRHKYLSRKKGGV